MLRGCACLGQKPCRGPRGLSDGRSDDEVYNRRGVKNPWLSQDIKPLGLSAQEQAELVAFLHALTGEIDPEVGRPPVLPY